MPVFEPAEAFLASRPNRTLLDVRSPAEFESGHIPGAFNLPLFSNTERAEVGTLYKQVNPQSAFLRGLEFAGARMRQYVETALKLAPERKVAVHCWRGGQRSGAMAWLLEMAGFEVTVLKGGYKAYRQFILAQLAEKPAKLLIVGGKTGTGKTEILHALRNAGEQIIDLEALAHHKGSAFGAIGEISQPGFEHFSNILYDTFASLNPEKPIWIESESKAIGKVQIPDEFWGRICTAPMIEIHVSIERRIQNLIQVYAHFPKEALADSFQKIAKRIGSQNLRTALNALDANDFARAAEIALAYYDKTYTHSLDAMSQGSHHHLHPEKSAPAEIAKQLIELSKINNSWN
jgi:tRNA 2-selenouridine synthase